jgi:hypothetical protein
VSTETSELLSSLNSQRDHVLGILDGLSGQALLTPALPTGWTCLGMVRHLAKDVEQFWFQRVVAGRPFDPHEFGDDAGDAWLVPAGTPPEVVLERYRREIELANDIISTTPLGAPAMAPPTDLWPNWDMPDLRTILLHVITETACHAGHLDAARELLDGRTWLRLTD